MTPSKKSARHLAQAATVKSFASLTDLPEIVQDQLAQHDKTIPLVAVLYTGGTIGMAKEDGSAAYTPSNDINRLLTPLKLKGIEKEVNILWVPVFEEAIDSTNGRWPHWVSVGNLIKLLYDHVTGFVVCNGTDTMAHMLAAMTLMFPNTGKPIVGTGSQRPMIKLGDDGTNNLYYAVTAAASDLGGVFLMFGDELMEGCRVHKINDTRFHAFGCPTEYIYGYFADGIVLHKHAPRRNPTINSKRLKYEPYFREGLKIGKISPVTPSESLLYDGLDPLCSMLLILTFGAGNVRNKGILTDEQTHVDCMWQLYQKGIPSILGSTMMDGRVSVVYTGAEDALALVKGKGNGISGAGFTGAFLEVLCAHILALCWDEEKDGTEPEKVRVCFAKFIEIYD